MFFSFSFPLITIPALLYFLGKHCVDRHNILYFHEETYVHHKVHLAVIKYFIMAPFFQLCLLTFNALLSKYYHQVGYGCALIVLAMIIWFALGQWFPNFLAKVCFYSKENPKYKEIKIGNL